MDRRGSARALANGLNSGRYQTPLDSLVAHARHPLGMKCAMETENARDSEAQQYE